MASSESIAAPTVRPPASVSEKATARDRSYRQDIDGLRAIAILSVVLYHASVPFVSGGFTGVDIFFAISGYLIGGHIFSELRSGNFSYLRFYQRRAKRILPAYFFVISFTVIAALFLLSPFEAAMLGRSAFASTLSVSNILFWKTSGYFDTRSEFNPLLMTWSLGVEEQFYVVVPLLMVMVTRIRRTLLLPAIFFVCAVSLAYAMYELGTQPGMVFYTLPPRAWELGLGVALAISQQLWRNFSVRSQIAELGGVIGLALILLPMFLLKVTTPFPGASALPSVVGTVILLAGPGNWVNRSILSLAPLAFIGRISYSLYLWHWPLLALARVVYGAELPPIITAAVVAIAFGAALVSYYFIEQPFRKSTLKPVPLLFRYAVAGVVMLAVCAAIWFSHGLPRRSPELAKMEAAGLELQKDPCLAPYGVETPNLSSACYQVSADRPSVAVWGDSHSAALSPGLRAAAKAEGLGFAQLTKASCPPLEGATRYLPTHVAAAAECLNFNRRVLQLIESNSSIKVVVLAGYWAAPLDKNYRDGWLAVDLANPHRVPSMEESHNEFKRALETTIRSLQGAGKKVIVFEDVPVFGADPLWLVRTSHMPARQALYRWMKFREPEDTGIATPSNVSSSLESERLLRETVADLSQVELIDLKPALCPSPGECLYRESDVLLYNDPQHLSAEGAKYALQKSNFLLLDAAKIGEKLN
jgi:peptidoglycan/LPS O-acetylase OafA/YrhL